MFERFVSAVLSRLLSEYVDGASFSQETIRIGVWSGNVVLQDLRLKPALLDMLQLPLTLRHGSVGRLELRIPWSHLGRDPIVVFLDRVFLCVEPRYVWDEEAAAERAQALKRANIAAAEMFRVNYLADLAERRTGGQGGSDGRKRRGGAQKWMTERLTERLINKIVDSLEIRIRAVHFRYEDRVSSPSCPFYVGLSFESLHIGSARNSGWEAGVVLSASADFANAAAAAAGNCGGGGRAGGAGRGNAGGTSGNSGSWAKGGRNDAKGGGSGGGDGGLAARLIRKTAELRSLCIYWNGAEVGNPCCMHVSDLTPEEADIVMDRLVSRRLPDAIASCSGDDSDDNSGGENGGDLGGGDNCGCLGGTSSEGASTGGISGGLADGSVVGEGITPAPPPGPWCGHWRSGDADDPATGDLALRHRCILRPVDVVAHITLSKDPADGALPKAAVAVTINAVDVRLEAFQYRDVMCLAAAFARFDAQHKYVQWRPVAPPLADPAAWWRYAIQATLHTVRGHADGFSCERLTRRRALRLEYSTLWQKNMGWDWAAQSGGGGGGGGGVSCVAAADSGGYDSWALSPANGHSSPDYSSGLSAAASPSATDAEKALSLVQEEAALDAAVAATPVPTDGPGGGGGSGRSGGGSRRRRRQRGIKRLMGCGKEQRRRLAELEAELSFEDIMLFRAMAEREALRQMRESGLVGAAAGG
ncbi:unnamed protein product, partial [Phaeothamnion confervicola]